MKIITQCKTGFPLSSKEKKTGGKTCQSKNFFFWFCFGKPTHPVRTKLNPKNGKKKYLKKDKTSSKEAENPNFNYHHQHKSETFKSNPTDKNHHPP